MFVLEWCYKATGDGEQVLWRYWLPEVCITKWYDRPQSDDCLCKKFWLGEQWSSDIAVSCKLAKHSDIQTENTKFETLWLSPLVRVSSNVANGPLLHLLFLTSLNILSGCPIINICGCHQDLKLLWIGPMTYNPYTTFFYSILLTHVLWLWQL